MKRAPETYNGKKLIFEETFRSPFVRPTKEAAQKILDNIRTMHASEQGWLEIEAGIEPKDGGFVAVRHHAKYK